MLPVREESDSDSDMGAESRELGESAAKELGKVLTLCQVPEASVTTYASPSSSESSLRVFFVSLPPAGLPEVLGVELVIVTEVSLVWLRDLLAGRIGDTALVVAVGAGVVPSSELSSPARARRSASVTSIMGRGGSVRSGKLKPMKKLTPSEFQYVVKA